MATEARPGRGHTRDRRITGGARPASGRACTLTGPVPARSILLAASFPPALGGLETLLCQAVRRLPEPPLVVAPPPAAAPGLRVVQAHAPLLAQAAYRPLWRLHPSLYYLLTFWGPALKAARSEPPDVVQCGHVYLAPLARRLARRLHHPWALWAFGQEVWRKGHPMGLPALDDRLRGAAIRAADAVFVPGAFTASLLADWRVDPSRVVHVPCGAEPRPPAPEPNGATLLTVCRLVPRKGVDTVIRALPDIARIVPSVEYRVVGAGPDEPRLRALAVSSGAANHVHFLGRVDDATLEQEYRDCSLFVLPARRTADGQLEGLGIVYLEAAAWGRPSVAGRTGGESDAIVDGETGVLVDGSDVQAVAGAISSLLQDPSRLRVLGSAARRRVETTHNWSNAARVVSSTLDRLSAP